jgi:phosphoglycolate phosphatase
VTPDEIGGLDRAVGRFRDCYADHLLDTTRPYPGIIEMCDRLVEKGIRLGVVTNKIEDLSRRIIEGLGLSGRFRVLLGGDSLPARKPDPSPLLQALEEMNVPVARAAMVGDSAIDIEAGRRAGIRVAAVTWGFVSAENLKKAKPDYLADDPERLEAWLLGG